MNHSVSESAMLGALRRLAAAPGIDRLYAAGNRKGLFPSKGSRSSNLVDALSERGFIDVAQDGGEGGRVSITDVGRSFLLSHESPIVLLEDLLRITEQQAESSRRMEAQHRREIEVLEKQAGFIRRILERIAGAEPADLGAVIESRLRAHASSGRAGDATLGEIYRDMSAKNPNLSIGQFHDAIRALAENGAIRLIPWTGPLYQLPEPAFALLIGHEVLYYVQLARRSAA